MNTDNIDSRQQRWARFRFAVIGPLLSSPPPKGTLQRELQTLAQRDWLHPITGQPTTLAQSTIERWYYRAKRAADPISALRPKRREDAGHQRMLTTQLSELLRNQYQQHKSWSYQLHFDNLLALMQERPELGPKPSYSTVRRHMKSSGLSKQRRIVKRDTAGAQAAEKRLQTREVRSYEVDYVHGLWHLDYHHGSRSIITTQGGWAKPMLLAIMDDRSRLICHAQWYLDETSESLVHGFTQAIQKRALPRALMSDNGAAMTCGEFTQGLERLGIQHQTTLPYSPYQNAKQEVFWNNIEGRLMAMLEGKKDITLALLNQATHAWLEQEYHHRHHSELKCSPLQRYLEGPDVGRDSPASDALRSAFRLQVKRKLRRSDGTVSLEGSRFEIPSQYLHLEYLYLQYARWDLTQVELVDEHENKRLCRIYPLDKSANASGKRRTREVIPAQQQPLPESGVAPLLQQYMADYAATGLPPAYLPKDDEMKRSSIKETT